MDGHGGISELYDRSGRKFSLTFWIFLWGSKATCVLFFWIKSVCV